MLLKLKNITKQFDQQTVINDYNLEIGPSEIVVLVGRSGTGKTTFLRIINNLEKADAGEIRINGDPLLENGQYVSREKQRSYQNRIGMVFQDYELFSNLTVLENLVEAPLAQKIDTKENLTAKARELLVSMEISDKADAIPSTLSGGQAQRVAIARAMMLSPDILCFDEPTSALDAESAAGIGKLIQDIANRGTGILIVTHDTAFAESYGTRIIRSEEFI